MTLPEYSVLSISSLIRELRFEQSDPIHRRCLESKHTLALQVWEQVLLADSCTVISLMSSYGFNLASIVQRM